MLSRTPPRDYKTFGLAMLTGMLMTIGFPPYDIAKLSWMPFVAFVPLAWVLLCFPFPGLWRRRMWRAFLLGWVAGFVFFLLTLAWLRVVAWEGVIFLPAYLAVYPALWAVFVVMVVRSLRGASKKSSLLSSGKNFLAAMLSAAAWTGLEWLRSILFSGFGWNSFGVAFHRNIPLIQIADITGVSGLSFLAVMTSCIVAMSLQRLMRELKQRPVRGNKSHLHLDIALMLLVIVFVMSYGLRELLAPAPAQEELSIAAVQGNIPQDHKWDHAFEEEIMATYARQTKVALALHPDLVVWPEAATPRPLLRDEATFFQVQQLMNQGHADFLIGSLHYEDNPPRDYNAAILLSSGGKFPQFYAKVHLVPFGEYVPFRKTFPLFQWIIGDRVLGDFNPGPGPKTLELSTKQIKIAPLLCFEDTLGDLVRRFAKLDAQLLITLTNDGWFGRTIASEQHLVNALFRSAETKIPLLRVANTGVTCIIDRFGRVSEKLHDAYGCTFLEGVLAAPIKVPVHPAKTFYTQHGDWFAKGCLGVALLALAIALRKRNKD